MKYSNIIRRSDAVTASQDTSFITRYPSFIIGRIDGSLEFWSLCNININKSIAIADGNIQENNNHAPFETSNDLENMACLSKWKNTCFPMANQESNLFMNDCNPKVNDEPNRFDNDIIVDGIKGICVVKNSNEDQLEKNLLSMHVFVATKDGKIILFLLSSKHVDDDQIEGLQNDQDGTLKWCWIQYTFIDSRIMLEDSSSWVFAGPPSSIKLKPDEFHIDNEAVIVPMKSEGLLLFRFKRHLSSSDLNEKKKYDSYLKVSHVSLDHPSFQKKRFEETNENDSLEIIRMEPLYGTFDANGCPLVCLTLNEHPIYRYHPLDPIQYKIECYSLQEANASLSTSNNDETESRNDHGFHSLYTLKDGPWSMENAPSQTFILPSHDRIRQQSLDLSLSKILSDSDKSNSSDIRALQGIQQTFQNSGILCFTPQTVQFYSHNNGMIASEDFFPRSLLNENTKEFGFFKIKGLCNMPPSTTATIKIINNIFPYVSTEVLVWIEEKREAKFDRFHLFQVILRWNQNKTKDGMCSIDIIPLAFEDSLISNPGTDEVEKDHILLKSIFDSLSPGSICVSSGKIILSGSYLFKIDYLVTRRDRTISYKFRCLDQRISTYPLSFTSPIHGAAFIPTHPSNAFDEKRQKSEMWCAGSIDGQLALISGENETSKLTFIKRGYFSPCGTIFVHGIYEDNCKVKNSVDVGLGNSSFFRSPLICLSPSSSKIDKKERHITHTYCLFFFSNNTDKTLVMKYSQIIKSTEASSDYSLEPIESPAYTLGIDDSLPTLSVCTIQIKSTKVEKTGKEPMLYRLLLHVNKKEVRCCRVASSFLTDSGFTSEDIMMSPEQKGDCMSAYQPPNGTLINHAVFSQDDVVESSKCDPAQLIQPVYCLLNLCNNTLYLIKLMHKYGDENEKELQPLLSFQSTIFDIKLPNSFPIELDSSESCILLPSEASAIALHTSERYKNVMDETKLREIMLEKTFDMKNDINYLLFAIAFHDMDQIYLYSMSQKSAKSHFSLRIFCVRGLSGLGSLDKISSIKFLPDEESSPRPKFSLVIGLSNGLVQVISDLYEDLNANDEQSKSIFSHKNPPKKSLITSRQSCRVGQSAPKLTLIYIRNKSSILSIDKDWLVYDRTELDTESKNGNVDAKAKDNGLNHIGFWGVFATSSQVHHSSPTAMIIGITNDKIIHDTGTISRKTIAKFIPLSMEVLGNTPFESFAQPNFSACEDLNTSFISIIPASNDNTIRTSQNCCWMAFSGKRLNFGYIDFLRPNLDMSSRSICRRSNDFKSIGTPTHIHILTLSSESADQSFQKKVLVLLAVENIEGSRLILYDIIEDESRKFYANRQETNYWQPIWKSENISPNKVITKLSFCPRSPLRSNMFKKSNCACVALSMIDYIDVAARRHHSHNIFCTNDEEVQSSITVLELSYLNSSHHEENGFQLMPIAKADLKGACYCVTGLEERLDDNEKEAGVLVCAIGNKLVCFKWKLSECSPFEGMKIKTNSIILDVIGNFCPSKIASSPFKTSVTALACTWGIADRRLKCDVIIAAMQLLHSVAVFTYDKEGSKISLLGIDLGKSRMCLNVTVSLERSHMPKDRKLCGSIFVSCVDQCSNIIDILSVILREEDFQFETRVAKELRLFKRWSNPLPGESIIQLCQCSHFSPNIIAIGSGGSVALLNFMKK